MKAIWRNLTNILIVLGLIAGVTVGLLVLTGAFWYYEVCPTGTERVGLPLAEWKPAPIPFFWEPPEGCQATNAIPLFLGEIGIIEDRTPRVPRLPG